VNNIGFKAIVLAAGKSTRIAPLAGNRPKPLLEIGGQAVLIRNLRWLAESGIEEVWLNLHYRPQAIRDLIGDGRSLGLKVHYSFEPVILGTAGGVRRVASEWSEAFLVLYGDSLVRADLYEMGQAHRAGRAPITIALFDKTRQPHTGIAGGTVSVSAEGRVVKFVEGDANPAATLVNAGLYIVEPEIVGRIPPGSFYDFARDLFPQLLRSGVPINSYLIDGYCLGLDTPEAYWRALRLINEGAVKL
jgi:NDP-sugar pyrophosphorylase family protein